MKAKVAIARCPDYAYDKVNRAIRKCLELLQYSVIPRNKKILLKPNLLSSRRSPEEPCNTHPAIVEAAARILKEDFNNRIYIGDSSGGMSYGQTDDAFSVSGLSEIAERLGIEIVNFEKTGVVKLKNEKNKVKKEFFVTNFINEVDCIVSLPKLKTHSLVGFTGAVKNVMGFVPGSGKREMHYSAPKPLKMAQCIVDLYSLVKPQLSIMDAVIGMDKNGPAAGRAREIGLVLAGSDAVSLDAVALEITGFNSSAMEFITDAQERGLGIGSMKDIEILGENIKDVKISDFEKPITRLGDSIANYLPGFILKKCYAGMTSGLPVINQGLCKRCNVCYDNCPVQTIARLPDERLIINHTNCIECYCCDELCPHDAIEIVIPYSVKVIHKCVDLFRLLTLKK